MNRSTRATKLALLSRMVEGRLTEKDRSDLRMSHEPIYLTLNLDGGIDIAETNDPTYHIEIFHNWQHTRCYWKYADGRIDEVDKASNQR